ncbi:MAG: SpoIIE family protein phosphatase, partial [Chloroflexi bacterium]|nr:SpoIIE family protein phosphatase [Chloroflexota bacterium]
GQPNRLILRKRIERIESSIRPPSAIQELNAMRTISEVMTSNIDLDDLLNLILNKLVATINAERGTLYLVDEQANELWSRVLMDQEGHLSEIRMRIGEGIAGHVAASGEVVNIPDVYADPRFNQDFDRTSGFRTRTMLAAPMFNPQQKIIGVVQLLNKQDGPFSWRDERLLAAMSSQAAISIENARLYQQEMQQRLINQELKTAYSIQASFLPASIPQHEGWDFAAVWQPIRNVAGDFYDFYQIDDGRLAVIIADVSGKGIPAALFMALSVTMLRFGMSLGLSPEEVTQRANELLLAEQRSRMFATTFIGYIDLENGGVDVASGGHNPSLLYRAAAQTCEYITAPGVAIGVFKAAEYGCLAEHMEPGDILVLYTDGITEVINTDEDEFGEDRLEHLIIEHAALPAQEITERVLDAVKTFAGEQALFDDATLVVVKRTLV